MSDDRACCYGAAALGVEHCTCWVEEYDQEQQPWTGELPAVRSRCCGDCAGLQGSPERSMLTPSGTVWEAIERQARTGGEPFRCHCGEDGVIMRRVVRRVNVVDGRVALPGEGAYRPGEVVVDGQRIRLLADGRPAPFCAAWSAMARAHGWGAR